MLRDGATVEYASGWGEAGKCSRARESAGVGWREVDRALRGIAKRRSALDAAEARWLREAVRLELWRELGKASMREYLEEVFGYGPQAAQERLRVAVALDQLPGCEQALGAGELPYSAVRELTRVVTPSTEAAWLDASRGKNLRQIEELVAGHTQGDLPDDPPDPELVTRVIRFEVQAATFALLRQARQVLEDERGSRLADDELVAALCGAVLSASPESDQGRARYQIAITTCGRCGKGTQQGGGVEVPIDAATIERAECDAQRIGRVDAGEGGNPARASQDVTPRTRRLVWRRDHGRCCVPGCRSARNLEIHHIVARADGGGHGPENLVLLCGGHHAALHRGQLAIRGTAPDELEIAWASTTGSAKDERRAPTRPHVGDRLRAATMVVELKDAIARLGFTRAEAGAAVDRAVSAVGPDVEPEVLLRESLKRCPRPVT